MHHGDALEIAMTILRTATGLGLMLLALVACSRADPELMSIRASGNGPDEFAILPTRPLEIPTDLASLPAPTPGGSNRTDQDPEADAIAALGGNVASGAAVDAGFVSYVTRFGVSPSIRSEIAAEDLEHRRDNRGRPLERWFSMNTYYDAYEAESLDRYLELERMRRAGVRTPAAPPQPQG
ncbi:MAG: hypothetical protein ACI8TF_000939 [Paracoccaceae bacterium]